MRLFLANLDDRIRPVLREIVVKRLDERLAELVARPLRPAGIAGLELVFDRGHRLGRFSPVLSGLFGQTDQSRCFFTRI
jgi:hypothetical protein